MEEDVIEESIFMDNIIANFVAPITTSRSLLQVTKDNVNGMTRTIRDFHEEIKSLKEELGQAKNHYENQLISKEYLDSFKQSSLANFGELYIIEKDFHIQISKSQYFHESLRGFVIGGNMCLEDMKEVLLVAFFAKS